MQSLSPHNPPLTSIQPDADDIIRDTPTVPPLVLDSGASPASQVEHRDRVNSNSTGDGASFADSATALPEETSSNLKMRNAYGLPRGQIFIEKYLCAFAPEFGIMIQGHMFLFPDYLCFDSRLIGHETIIAMPYSALADVSKRSTLGIPNALEILIGSEEEGKGLKLWFNNFVSRNEVYNGITAGMTKAERAEASASGTDTAVRFSSNNLAAQRHFATAASFAILPPGLSSEKDLAKGGDSGLSLSPPPPQAAPSTMPPCSPDAVLEDTPKCARDEDGDGTCNGNVLPSHAFTVHAGRNEPEFDDNPLPGRVTAQPSSAAVIGADADVTIEIINEDTERRNVSVPARAADVQHRLRADQASHPSVSASSPPHHDMQQPEQSPARRAIQQEERAPLASSPPPLPPTSDFESSMLEETDSNYKLRLMMQLPKGQILIDKYLCALCLETGLLQLVQGHMFLFQDYVVFDSRLIGNETTISIRYADIMSVSKKTTLGLFQNAIEIATLDQGRIFLTSFLSRDEAFNCITSRMKLLGHSIETLSPPALDNQTAMLLESSDARKGVTRCGGAHRRSLSLGGSIDLSIQNDVSAAIAHPDATSLDQASDAGTMELRALAESGSCEADVAVEVAVSYVAATSPHAPQLSRCEMLLSLASCDDLPAPPVPPNHVSPLVDLLLPLSVQEFFLCFISDDHQFNTKYHSALNNFSISCTPWAEDSNQRGNIVSDFEWKQKAKSGLGSMFGPKEIHCMQRLSASLSSNMSRCIMREEVTTPSVPYGDTFSCVSYTDVCSAPGNDSACLVSISAYVEFTKRPNYIVSGKIVSEAHKDYSDSAAVWKHMALAHCTDCEAMLSDFRTMTSTRLPSECQCDAADVMSLQDLSSRLHRVLSRSGSADSLGGGSRRNSETSRVGAERSRLSRHGSVDHGASNSTAIAMPSAVSHGEVLPSPATQARSRARDASAAAGVSPAVSASPPLGQMSNSKFFLLVMAAAATGACFALLVSRFFGGGSSMNAYDLQSQIRSAVDSALDARLARLGVVAAAGDQRVLVDTPSIADAVIQDVARRLMGGASHCSSTSSPAAAAAAAASATMKYEL